MGISGMVCLDMGKPALMWSIAPQGLSKTSKGFYNNQVYLGVGSEIFAVDSATGKITQRYALPKCVTYTQNPGQQLCGNYAKGVLSPFTLSIDRAVFINSSGDLQALNLQTGSLLWSTVAGGSTTIYENIAPAVVNGVVITSSWKTTYNASNLSVNTYGVNVYDVTSGQELASVPTGTLMVLDIKVAPDGSAIVVRTPEDLIFLATR
jgi:outer membrane protein assembly factor BamB